MEEESHTSSRYCHESCHVHVGPQSTCMICCHCTTAFGPIPFPPLRSPCCRPAAPYVRSVAGDGVSGTSEPIKTSLTVSCGPDYTCSHYAQ